MFDLTEAKACMFFKVSGNAGVSAPMVFEGKPIHLCPVILLPSCTVLAEKWAHLHLPEVQTSDFRLQIFSPPSAFSVWA